jgi:hypothetical protein
MTRARTEHAPVSFRVCEDAEGKPFIGTRENGPKTNSILNEHANLFLSLVEGKDIHEAERIVAFLNDNISAVSLTIFDQHKHF